MIEEETGIKKSEFEVTKWAKSKHGKSFAVEWQHPEMVQRLVWINPILLLIRTQGNGLLDQMSPILVGKLRGNQRKAGRNRGHILIDDVPAGRPPAKE